ncbi:MAG: 5'-methylthioadenosine/S-adenosylhomocysteine nucleosidase [Parasporobacterium sp.]|nr:5'-methylthioadenosine/S-adenosylhomocysteine nucleosidase [Parasporobacterium sp.]
MNRKKVGIVVAIEMNAVTEKYGEPVETINAHGYDVLVYDNGKNQMYFVNSGAGEINSAGATQVLISDFDVDMVMNFGVVGALTEEIKTAQLCIVEEVIDIDFGSQGWVNLPNGQHPEYDSAVLTTDAELLAHALTVNPELTKVRDASTNSFRNDEADKSAIREEFGADICEMEAAGIVYTCQRAGVPCLLVKAVSDSLTGGGKEFFTELNRVSMECFDTLDAILSSME